MDDVTPLFSLEKKYYMLQHFVITGNTNKPRKAGGSAYVHTVRFSVVCKNAERALKLAKDVYPDLEIMGVAHQGPVEKVDTEV